MSKTKPSIYVIYRPLPAALFAVVLTAIAGLAGLMLGVGVASAVAQRDPGGGTWDLSNAVTLTGTIVAEPYPMLLPDGGGPGVLLVGIAKSGPDERITSRAGERVALTGFELRRDGLRMLSIDDADERAVTDADAATSAPLRAEGRADARPLGRHTIDTQLLDSKCYLGAMMPGEGEGHRACAILCVRGGVPPMIAWRDESGESRYALVTAADGGVMPAELLDAIGRPVVVTGDVSARDGWLWIAVESAGVIR
ncbi:MAG: hypothetical protein AAFX79_08230 [Planctomycetota bacterium]